MVGYYRLNNLGFVLEAGAHVLPRASGEALDAANELVASAEAEREAILRQAKAAYEEERRRGYADGLHEARLEALQTLLHENVELDRGLRAAERDLVRVVHDSVRKIIASFHDTAIADALVRAALQQMRRERTAELRASSQLHVYFREKADEIRSEFPELELLDVILDPGLAADRIVVETSIGRVEIDTSQHLEDVLSIIQSAHVAASADTLDALRAANPGAGA